VKKLFYICGIKFDSNFGSIKQKYEKASFENFSFMVSAKCTGKEGFSFEYGNKVLNCIRGNFSKP